MTHWKVGDGLILPEGGEIIHQIALFEIAKEGEYIAVFYNEENRPIWLVPLLYNKKMRTKYTRSEAIKKYKLHL